MGAPIKTIGMFDVTISLHPEVHVTVKANVARSDDEAELQSQGVDVIAQLNEEEREEGEGFTEALDPDRELGELPPAEAAEEAAAEEAPADEAPAEEAAAEGEEEAEG